MIDPRLLLVSVHLATMVWRSYAYVALKPLIYTLAHQFDNGTSHIMDMGPGFNCAITSCIIIGTNTTLLPYIHIAVKPFPHTISFIEVLRNNLKLNIYLVSHYKSYYTRVGLLSVMSHVI